MVESIYEKSFLRMYNDEIYNYSLGYPLLTYINQKFDLSLDLKYFYIIDPYDVTVYWKFIQEDYDGCQNLQLPIKSIKRIQLKSSDVNQNIDELYYRIRGQDMVKRLTKKQIVETFRMWKLTQE